MAVQAGCGDRALANIDHGAEHARGLVGRTQNLGRPAQCRVRCIAFLQQFRRQQRTHELRHRGRADARQPHQFGPRQPAVGLHGFQNAPLVHPPQQIGPDLRLRFCRGTVDRRVFRCHHGQGLYTTRQIFCRVASRTQRHQYYSLFVVDLSRLTPPCQKLTDEPSRPQVQASLPSSAKCWKRRGLIGKFDFQAVARTPPRRSAKAASCSSPARVPAAFFRPKT